MKNFSGEYWQVYELFNVQILVKENFFTIKCKLLSSEKVH